MTTLYFIGGLAVLIIGAEMLVRGASRLTLGIGISPLVIGLTVVAFGTSAPELAVSIKASLSGQPGIALGNVIGSNIFNVLFILGISALITPLVVAQQLVRLDVPLMILLSLLVLVLGLDGVLGRGEGMLLVLGLVAYVLFLLYQSRSEKPAVVEEYDREFAADGIRSGGIITSLVLVVAGLGLLVIGSRWLVDSAVTAARYLGISDVVIGLTIIAAGTSLPEVVTSIIASLRGERDIAVGNVIGSNLFNVLGVLGVTCLTAPGGLPIPEAVLHFDIPVMIIVAFACLPIFFSGGIISRFEGALLFGYYLAYTLYLILAASHHDALPWFSNIMLYFAIPLSIFTVSIIAVREMYRKHRHGQSPE